MVMKIIDFIYQIIIGKSGKSGTNLPLALPEIVL